jgi:hypothetical protein
MLSSGETYFMKIVKWIVDGIWYSSMVFVFFVIIGIPGVSWVTGKTFFLKIFSRPLDVYEFPLFIIALIPVSVYFIILFQLRKLIMNIIEAQPFELVNYYRLRVIGWGIIMLGIPKLWYLIISWNDISLHEKKSFLEAVWLNLVHLKGLPYEYILAGLSVLCVAEVFRLGAEMREELNLTI